MLNPAALLQSEFLLQKSRSFYHQLQAPHKSIRSREQARRHLKQQQALIQK